jgi:CubicO group peptidase (beta-lactamase class C family)
LPVCSFEIFCLCLEKALDHDGQDQMTVTRRTGIIGGLSAVLSGLGAGCARAAPACESLAGRWGGTLRAGGQELRLVLEIDAAGAASLISIDQGQERIPATGGACSADGVKLVFRSVGGHLEAKKTPDGALEGTWKQGTSLPLRLDPLMGDAVPMRAAPTQRGSLETEVPAARAEANTPGLAAAWRRGERLEIVSDGRRAVERDTAVTDNDLWHIGSITKSMTGTMLARLVERGTLRWEETLESALGALVPDMRADYRSASLLDLVTGRSGLPTNIAMTKFVLYPREEADPRVSRLKYTREALSMAPEGARGASFVYPNNGFVVAAMLAEQRTGKPWEALVRDEVFVPFGMESAGFGPPPSANASAPANPVGHRNALLGGRPVTVGAGPDADNPAVLGPAGRAHMTMADLTAFGLAHARGLVGSPDALPGYLSAESWRLLHTPPSGSDYAVGWVRRADGTSWHNGSNTLFYAELSVSSASITSAAAATNWAAAEAAVTRVMEAAEQEAASSR